MVAERFLAFYYLLYSCSLAKISMVAEHVTTSGVNKKSCSLAKISMVAERAFFVTLKHRGCSLAKISMVAELMVEF